VMALGTGSEVGNLRCRHRESGSQLASACSVFGFPWVFPWASVGRFRGPPCPIPWDLCGFPWVSVVGFFWELVQKSKRTCACVASKVHRLKKSRLLVCILFLLSYFFYCLFVPITYCLLPVCSYCLLPICACCLCLVCVAQHQLAPARLRQFFFGSQPLLQVIRVHPCKFVVLVLVYLPFVVPTRNLFPCSVVSVAHGTGGCQARGGWHISSLGDLLAAGGGARPCRGGWQLLSG
jgi:hypothetical protein